MAEDTFMYKLLDREMTFRYPKSGQLIMLFRIRDSIKKSGSDTTMDQLASVTQRMLDLIDSLFIHEQERADIEDAMIKGVVDVEDLLPLLYGGKSDEDEPDDDEDPKPRKAAGRKAPVKKAAKKVAKKAPSVRAKR